MLAPYNFRLVNPGIVERKRGWIQGVNHDVTIVCASNPAFLEEPVVSMSIIHCSNTRIAGNNPIKGLS
jgi:hypothetical protein